MDKCGEGRLLEFATVGRDQIHFWAFTKDEKLSTTTFLFKNKKANKRSLS